MSGWGHAYIVVRHGRTERARAQGKRGVTHHQPQHVLDIAAGEEATKPLDDLVVTHLSRAPSQLVLGEDVQLLLDALVRSLLHREHDGKALHSVSVPLVVCAVGIEQLDERQRVELVVWVATATSSTCEYGIQSALCKLIYLLEVDRLALLRGLGAPYEGT